ncbi:hypothetical protein E1A91_A03G139500v1 [Gossypium mustelinum]|uniref:Uncharacterized protein n=5 Tax=Gossypium TaxID=3633 RepID=A0A2P5WZN4_GOSBA|nr:uncharacterized protein LOC108475151 [Gossypium arboreum]KAB2090635.1 hypothetical protein ES319_A03G136300v1 [Gossypium barbadense]TYH25237.1 hypothetical protein ES288_A03G153300v1 [Gossypium darwinii]TYI36569.1 hypothetical protein ES332_A03G150700v1 [Gossypium tomentosum]TYJ43224.1 hypothetical protein E1A91_A03G139500v1 [Gossypium mustelinum]KAK5839032.1 hypothetical protein PVK06_007788 [Gossypium arboreum]
METTSSLCNNHSLASPLPFRPPSKTVYTKILASKRDAHSHNFDGKLVDQNMIVLRMRIHEMTKSEKSYEPPRHWMEWEKEYKKSYYDLDVCEALGYLQYKLMETRPSFALGMALLLLLSLPTSFAIVLFHLMHIIKGFYL